MVRQTRFLSDDPDWVDPSRFVDDRNDDDADFEPPAVRKSRHGRGRVKSKDHSARQDPRRGAAGGDRGS